MSGIQTRGGLLREAFFTAGGTKRLDFAAESPPTEARRSLKTQQRAITRLDLESFGCVQVRPVACAGLPAESDGQIQNSVKSEGGRHVYGGAR